VLTGSEGQGLNRAATPARRDRKVFERKIYGPYDGSWFSASLSQGSLIFEQNLESGEIREIM
jgi:hypothetical protein